jgi:hypothetical protein
MSVAAISNHILLALAVVAGIIGMGTVFDAAMHLRLAELSAGIPILMVGLWWAGHELARSSLASKAKRSPEFFRGSDIGGDQPPALPPARMRPSTD